MIIRLQVHTLIVFLRSWWIFRLNSLSMSSLELVWSPCTLPLNVVSTLVWLPHFTSTHDLVPVHVDPAGVLLRGWDGARLRWYFAFRFLGLHWISIVMKVHLTTTLGYHYSLFGPFVLLDATRSLTLRYEIVSLGLCVVDLATAHHNLLRVVNQLRKSHFLLIRVVTISVRIALHVHLYGRHSIHSIHPLHVLPKRCLVISTLLDGVLVTVVLHHNFIFYLINILTARWLIARNLI